MVSKYGVFLVQIFPYSVQIQENTDQKNPYMDSFHAMKDLLEMLQKCREGLL